MMYITNVQYLYFYLAKRGIKQYFKKLNFNFYLIFIRFVL
jgi:hypothetical protein